MASTGHEFPLVQRPSQTRCMVVDTWCLLVAGWQHETFHLCPYVVESVIEWCHFIWVMPLPFYPPPQSFYKIITFEYIILKFFWLYNFRGETIQSRSFWRQPVCEYIPVQQHHQTEEVWLWWFDIPDTWTQRSIRHSDCSGKQANKEL